MYVLPVFIIRMYNFFTNNHVYQWENASILKKLLPIITWLASLIIQLYIANGALVSLIVSQHTGDLDLVFIDKSLVGKVSADNPSDGETGVDT